MTFTPHRHTRQQPGGALWQESRKAGNQEEPEEPGNAEDTVPGRGAGRRGGCARRRRGRAAAAAAAGCNGVHWKATITNSSKFPIFYSGVPERRILLSQNRSNLHRAVKYAEPASRLTSSDAGECGGGEHADGEDRAQHLESGGLTIAGRDEARVKAGSREPREVQMRSNEARRGSNHTPT